MNFIFKWQNNIYERAQRVSKILLLPRDLFLLYRQKDIDKIIEGNYRNYVID